MIEKNNKLRIARPTDNLSEITKMYIDGLGFSLLGEFQGHNGFDGSIIGHENHLFHLEFTHHRETVVGKAPTKDNLLVFYIEDSKKWKSVSESMLAAGFKEVSSYNSYWDVSGRTFEDIDGYRIILQNREWSA